MTTNRRISDYPDGDETAAATAVVAQAGETKSYQLGTAAGKNAGGDAGDLPILGTGGVVSTADGGTGLSVASPGANKVFGTDGSGDPVLHDLPGGSLSIADRSVTADKLADNAVITRTIAADAIGRDQIKDGEVIASKIGAAAVGTSNIADGAVDTDQIAAFAITTGKYANASVTNAVMANNAVRYAQIGATNAGTDGQLLSRSTSGGNVVLTWVDASTPSIADGSIVGSKLADATITQGKLAENSVGAAQLIDASVNRHKMAITGTPSAGDVIIWDGVNSRLYWGPQSASGLPGNNSITNAMLQDDIITAAEIDNGAVTNAAISNTAAIALSKLSIGGTQAAGKVIKATSATAASWEDETGGSGLTIGGTQAAGRVMIARSSTTQSWEDPANPTPLGSWGSIANSSLISLTSATNTTLINNQDGVYALVNNEFNAITQDIGGASITWLFSPNLSSSGSARVLPTGIGTFRTGLFGRSGGNNHIYLTIGSSGAAYSQRVGQTWTTINSANSNTNLLYTSAENLPNDDRWYPMAQAALPSGISYGLGKRSSTNTIVVGLDIQGNNYSAPRVLRSSTPITFAVGDVAFSKLTGIGGTQASGKYLGASSSSAVAWVDAPNTTPANNSITTAMIQDDAITAAKLDNNAVVTAAINDGAITNAKVSATAAIAASKLASIPYSKLTGTPTIPTALPPTAGSVINASVASNAAIAQSKLAALTTSDLPSGTLFYNGTPADDQIPVYSSTNSRWQLEAKLSGGGGSTEDIKYSSGSGRTGISSTSPGTTINYSTGKTLSGNSSKFYYLVVYMHDPTTSQNTGDYTTPLYPITGADIGGNRSFFTNSFFDLFWDASNSNIRLEVTFHRTGAYTLGLRRLIGVS